MKKTNVQSPQFLEIPELLTRAEVACLLHVSLSYVDHLHEIPCYKLGKKKLFSKSEILDYLKNNHFQPAARKISKTDAINSKEEANG